MPSIEEVKAKLIESLDDENNVADVKGSLSAIEFLEKFPMTKEILEATRLGMFINLIRRKNSNSYPELSGRCKNLIREWQKLVIGGGGVLPTPGTVSNGSSPALHPVPASSKPLTPLGPGLMERLKNHHSNMHKVSSAPLLKDVEAHPATSDSDKSSSAGLKLKIKLKGVGGSTIASVPGEQANDSDDSGLSSRSSSSRKRKRNHSHHHHHRDKSHSTATFADFTNGAPQRDYDTIRTSSSSSMLNGPSAKFSKLDILKEGELAVVTTVGSAAIRRKSQSPPVNATIIHSAAAPSEKTSKIKTTAELLAEMTKSLPGGVTDTIPSTSRNSNSPVSFLVGCPDDSPKGAAEYIADTRVASEYSSSEYSNHMAALPPRLGNDLVEPCDGFSSRSSTSLPALLAPSISTASSSSSASSKRKARAPKKKQQSQESAVVVTSGYSAVGGQTNFGPPLDSLLRAPGRLIFPDVTSQGSVNPLLNASAALAPFLGPNGVPIQPFLAPIISPAFQQHHEHAASLAGAIIATTPLSNDNQMSFKFNETNVNHSMVSGGGRFSLDGSSLTFPPSSAAASLGDSKHGPHRLALDTPAATSAGVDVVDAGGAAVSASAHADRAGVSGDCCRDKSIVDLTTGISNTFSTSTASALAAAAESSQATTDGNCPHDYNRMNHRFSNPDLVQGQASSDFESQMQSSHSSNSKQYELKKEDVIAGNSPLISGVATGTEQIATASHGSELGSKGQASVAADFIPGSQKGHNVVPLESSKDEPNVLLMKTSSKTKKLPKQPVMTIPVRSARDWYSCLPPLPEKSVSDILAILKFDMSIKSDKVGENVNHSTEGESTIDLGEDTVIVKSESDQPKEKSNDEAAMDFTNRTLSPSAASRSVDSIWPGVNCSLELSSECDSLTVGVNDAQNSVEDKECNTTKGTMSSEFKLSVEKNGSSISSVVGTSTTKHFGKSINQSVDECSNFVEVTNANVKLVASSAGKNPDLSLIGLGVSSEVSSDVDNFALGSRPPVAWTPHHDWRERFTYKDRDRVVLTLPYVDIGRPDFVEFDYVNAEQFQLPQWPPPPR